MDEFAEWGQFWQVCSYDRFAGAEILVQLDRVCGFGKGVAQERDQAYVEAVQVGRQCCVGLLAQEIDVRATCQASHIGTVRAADEHEAPVRTGIG